MLQLPSISTLPHKFVDLYVRRNGGAAESAELAKDKLIFSYLQLGPR